MQSLLHRMRARSVLTFINWRREESRYIAAFDIHENSSKMTATQVGVVNSHCFLFIPN